jgi:hypothetical protein
LAMLLAITGAAAVQCAAAFELRGAWASDVDRLHGKFMRCKIKTRSSPRLTLDLDQSSALPVMFAAVIYLEGEYLCCLAEGCYWHWQLWSRQP